LIISADAITMLRLGSTILFCNDLFSIVTMAYNSWRV